MAARCAGAARKARATRGGLINAAENVLEGQSWLDAFRGRLVELGWSEGRNIQQLQAAAPSMSIELKFVDVRKPDDFSAAFRKMTEAYKQGVYIAECALCYSERKKLAQIAAETRIPAIYVTRAFADDGRLMSYGVDYAEAARRAAVYVDKTLRGAKPGDLPIEQRISWG